MELKLKDDTKNESRDNQRDAQFIQNDVYGGRFLTNTLNDISIL